MKSTLCKSLIAVAILGQSLALGAEEQAADGAEEQAAEDKFAPVRDLLQTCVACHGEGGASASGDFPILAGQELYYLYVQLKDYKSGLRANPIMQPIAAPLEKDQMMLLAEYFSEQTWPDIVHDSDPANTRPAKSAINAGQCVACHLGGFEGNSRVPRLAGQYPQYLAKTLLEYKHKVRNNAPDKATLMASFEEQDLESLADYLAGLKPEPAPPAE